MVYSGGIPALSALYPPNLAVPGVGAPTSAQSVAPPSQPSRDAQSCSGCMERCCPLASHSLPASTWNGQGWFVCKQNAPAFICITSSLCQKENNKIKEQSTAVNTNLKAVSSIPGSSNTCPRTPNPSVERWRFWKEVAENRKVFPEIPEALIPDLSYEVEH